ncbi:ketopantoate reductase family protein [Actinomadura logoneensis]|uniref:Ketopantoate reductase family protein n=1 Tax=Actinomadura logoneensis TaxID=2293572 RepID=A0A372JAH7_9ACTN|nr:2-dehydropantoate 2-reductase N-terminal domain-containing protein [Actinomadura logoneensis]RFU36982.1 ketopantoate reductase family protein [Actinomadura logoneensis]
MRYVVIGAGAIGCSIGGRLHQAGHDVVLVARGEHGRVLREDGLTLVTPGERLRLRVPVVSGPDEVELDPDHVLVLAVKTQDTVAALDAWRHRPVRGGGTAGERLPVFCAQNGVANERMALRRFRHVYGAFVLLPASYLEPGEVIAPCGPLTGLLVLGRHPSGADGTAERIGADLAASRFRTEVVPDLPRWKYLKLLGNLGNAIEAVCGEPSPDLHARAWAEADRVLEAAGIGHAANRDVAELRGDAVEVRHVDGVSELRNSSWQSLARGGSLETDYLNGEIVLLGRLHGVPTPVNETLLDVANEFARLRRSPGELTLKELTARVPG